MPGGRGGEDGLGLAGLGLDGVVVEGRVEDGFDVKGRCSLLLHQTPVLHVGRQLLPAPEEEKGVVFDVGEFFAAGVFHVGQDGAAVLHVALPRHHVRFGQQIAVGAVARHSRQGCRR